MKNMEYVLRNFFTHKDYLAPASEIPGTLFTPLSFAFAGTILALVIFGAIYVSRRRHLVKPVLAVNWAILLVWEFGIIAWESLSGPVKELDLATNLSLYPCSLYLYTMPLILWGRGTAKKASCGYLMTLGLLGALINFIYPVTRLSYYSCISFVGFHTTLYHASMLFACLVLFLSEYTDYRANRMRDLFLPCIPSLLLSIPANLVNYSSIDADYMFFRGKMNVVAMALPGFSEIQTTLTLYVLYILIPALFYLPGLIQSRRQPVELDEKELAWSFSNL